MAAVALLAASNAVARDFDEPRWYGALDVGAHWPGDIDSRSTWDAPDGKPYDWRWKFNNGWQINGRLGYRVTQHIRLEGEFGFQHTTLASVNAPGANVGGFSASRPGEPWGLCAAPPVNGSCASASGRNTDVTAIYTGMANAIYDVWPERKLSPFFGAGVGLTHIQMVTTYWFSGVPGAIAQNNPTPQTLKLAGTLTRPGEFAIQGIAGVSYRLAPRMHVDLTYRHYFTPGSVRWNPMNYTWPRLPAGTALETGDFLGHFSGQSVTAGLRYAF